jgi:hypothetical protein
MIHDLLLLVIGGNFLNGKIFRRLRPEVRSVDVAVIGAAVSTLFQRVVLSKAGFYSYLKRRKGPDLPPTNIVNIHGHRTAPTELCGIFHC